MRQDPPLDKVGSLHLPDSANKNYPDLATVLAVGPKVTDQCPGAGARVLFTRRPGSALIQDDRVPDQNSEWLNLLMLREEDIMAEISGEGA